MLKSTIKLFFLCYVLIAQGDTEVYLFDLISNANNYSIKNLRYVFIRNKKLFKSID